MTLSIVIPSFNQFLLLEKCLESVVQHMPAGTQILVVDDGSRGAKVTQIAQTYSNITVLRHQTPQGFCKAANLGIRQATGDVVEMLNDDTQVAAGWATQALKCFDNPEIVAVAPLVWQGRPEQGRRVIDSAGDEYDVGGFAQKRGHGLTMVPKAGPVWGVSATAGFYRRSTLLQTGLFEERFGAYFEDVDLSFRLRKHGYIAFEPTSEVWHVGHRSYGRKPARRTLERQSCNEERVFWRHVGWRRFPRHTMVLAGKALKRWEEGNLLPWSFGRLRAWCGQ